MKRILTQPLGTQSLLLNFAAVIPKIMQCTRLQSIISFLLCFGLQQSKPLGLAKLIYSSGWNRPKSEIVFHEA